jgi:hypothetical protein
VAEHSPSDATYYGDRVCRRCRLTDEEMTEDDLGDWVVWPCPTIVDLAEGYGLKVTP